MSFHESRPISWTVPVQDLPNEVLVTIFKAGVSKPSLDHHGIPFPCIVASVCSQWRDVALTSPDLWTIVKINDSPSEASQLYWGRSKDRPLHLFFSITEYYHRNWSQIYYFLYTYSKRIRALTITVDAGRNLDRGHLVWFYDVISVGTTHLEYIEFNFTGNILGLIGRQSDWLATMFLEALPIRNEAALRSMRLNGFGLFDCRLSLHSQTHLTTLTSLHLEINRYPEDSNLDKNWYAFRVFLSRFIYLEELVIEGTVLPLPHDTSSETIIVIPLLRSLAFRWPYKDGSQDLAEFIHGINVPLLTYLELGSVSRSDLNKVARLVHPNNYIMLHTLRLSSCASDPETLSPEFYELFDSVRELQLARSDHCYFSPPPDDMSEESVTRAQAFSGVSRWPSLEVLSYDSCDFTWLRDLVQSRISQGSPLQAVRIIKSHFQPQHVGWLKEWVTVQCMADNDSGLLSASS